MMAVTSLDTVCSQLVDLGYEPRVISLGENSDNCAVMLTEEINHGRLKGKQVKFAIGMQEDSFPDYPPHFVYIADILSDKLPVHSSYNQDGHKWSAFSVPPSDFWDNLPDSEKNMKTYLNRHLIRFWDQI